jgi:site-specific DNA recombinase
MGRIFDDRGNRMTPSSARKRGKKYRYYLSSALAQGQPENAGSVRRVPASEIETLVVDAVRKRLNDHTAASDRDLINSHVAPIEIHADRLAIELVKKSNKQCEHRAEKAAFYVPWKKSILKRHRKLITPASSGQDVRPIRFETRVALVTSIACGRRWPDESSRVMAPMSSRLPPAKNAACGRST